MLVMRWVYKSLRRHSGSYFLWDESSTSPHTVHWSQIISKTVQLGAADEILARAREEGDARESANGQVA